MNSELLKELSNADSVASVEDEVRSILYRELAKYSDEVFSDRLGSIIFHKKGCYVCTEGPRFETAAEIKMFAMLGGDLVGMTNMPESLLAREAEMCYTNCSIVTNMAAGISPTPLSHSEVVEAMDKSIKNMEQLISAFIAANEADSMECGCPQCMTEFGGFTL